MRPTKYLTKWSRRDRALAEGLLEYEKSLNQFGVPSHIALDPDRKWTVDESVDHSVAVYEENRKAYETGEGAPPGMFLTLIDKGVPDEG